MNQDFEFLKKKYSENFAKLCRGLFPTLMEQEGLLSKLITEHFAENKFLYDDIVKNNVENEFKNFIYSFTEKEKNEKTLAVVEESPFELMKKAGYTLYKCETNADVQAFKKYWEKSEELCTFRDSNRVYKNLVFFAVKDNANDIKRENFKNPLRQDAYGTSVIGIQFTRTNPSTLSIKNRYNHSVANPDATFSNDLENIYAGLTASFVKAYDLNLVNEENNIEIPGYVLAKDSKYYKYNYEIDNVYYCTDNIIIDENREVIKFDKNKELLFDYFVVDFENKKIKAINKNYHDVFVDGLKNIVKIQVEKKENEKVLILTLSNKEDVFIHLNNENKIIKYTNPNLKEVGDNFLCYNQALNDIDVPNLIKAGKSFLLANKALTTLNAPNLKEVGDNFLCYNQALKELDVPKLTTTGSSFLLNNQSLTKLNLPSLIKAGNRFLFHNQNLTTFEAPNLIKADYMFLASTELLTELSLPSLQVVEEGFLHNSVNLATLYAPKLELIGIDFLYNNEALTELNLPNALKIRENALYVNEALKKVNLPRIEFLGSAVLDNHPNRDEFLETLEKTMNRNNGIEL